EFSFELPIRVDDLSLPEELRGRYQPTVKTRTVRIKAGGALQSRLIGQGNQAAAWARDNLRLSVWILPRGDGTQYPDEFAKEAQLGLLPPLRAQVNPLESALAETVSATLRRQNPCPRPSSRRASAPTACAGAPAIRRWTSRPCAASA